MPWFDENGLFPGLGVPSIDAAEAAAEAAGDAGTAGVSATGAAGAAGAGAAGASATGVGAVGSAGFGLGAAGFSAFGSAFLAGFSTFGKAPRSFAATGGVMVDEPPLTYSPSSSSLDNATLVSMPSSLAMSYTRGSATYFSCPGPTPIRVGLTAERISFRGTHIVASMFSAYFSNHCSKATKSVAPKAL